MIQATCSTKGEVDETDEEREKAKQAKQTKARADEKGKWVDSHESVSVSVHVCIMYRR